ncbi:MAG: DUF4091 domain-containing protein [Bacteroidaceae bacterium]|nr:DUF4091 domain-containing protein [Bacteroidaceae bacterium]
MKKYLLFIVVLIVTSITVSAQNQGVTHTGRNTGQVQYPLKEYKELENPVAVDAAKWRGIEGKHVAWGSIDERYSQEVPPQMLQGKSIEVNAWKGERVHAQFAVYGNEYIRSLNFEVSDLQSKQGDVIRQDRLLKGFVRYVMTDELNKNGKSGCGKRPDATQWDSTLVADVIDHLATELEVKAYNTQGGWIRVWVPQDAKTGVYTGTVTVKNGNELIDKLELKVNVKNHVLPEPANWAYHLDLWQNPYAVARYYQVEPWSEAHMDAMKPIMQMYQQAGGKVITASIMHKPWNGQTFDYFESMVTWIKKLDGSWAFDFAVFDKWVQFMMDLGVKKEIGCYSMVPWALSFQYFDQASNSMKFVHIEPGEPAYDEMWTAMLQSFAKHLKEKGWFEITHIAMDERSIDVMLKTLKVIRKADPEFKISMAGNLYDELVDELNDYCITMSQKWAEDIIKKRRAEGKTTTFYTCCAEAYPNTFTFSAPAEAEWLALYAEKANLDGYLRWAYNSWVPEPLLDSRYITWAAGDTYLVYPEARTSIRFERLVSGIQDYEKIKILRKELKPSALQRLDKVLSTFDETLLPATPASTFVNKVKAEIDRF